MVAKVSHKSKSPKRSRKDQKGTKTQNKMLGRPKVQKRPLTRLQTNHRPGFQLILKSLSKLQGKPKTRPPKKSKMAVLRTRIWMETTLRDHKISLKDLEQKFYDLNERTGTVDRWRKGDQTAGKGSVRKLAKLLPGSNKVYELPVFELLELDITEDRLKQLLAKYTANVEELNLIFWILPKNDTDPQPTTNTVLKDDSDQLFRIGGVYGFIAILILLREAEFNNDVIAHEHLIKDAYRALPGFCRDRRFKKHWAEFYNALKSIHGNMYSSFRLVQPRREVIKAQIFAKEHVTLRHLRPRSTSDRRFTELEKPYREARF